MKSFVNSYIIHQPYNKIDIFKLIKDHHLNINLQLNVLYGMDTYIHLSLMPSDTLFSFAKNVLNIFDIF